MERLSLRSLPIPNVVSAPGGLAERRLFGGLAVIFFSLWFPG